MKFSNLAVAMACVAVLSACDGQQEAGATKPAADTASASLNQNIFAAQYAVESTTWKVTAGSPFTIPVTVKNASAGTWSSQTEKNPVLLSYNWMDSDGLLLQRDGLRTVFAEPLSPGSEVTLNLAAQAPKDKGTYVMQVNLVQESVAWFDSKQVKPLSLTIHVE